MDATNDSFHVTPQLQSLRDMLETMEHQRRTWGSPRLIVEPTRWNEQTVMEEQSLIAFGMCDACGHNPHCGVCMWDCNACIASPILSTHTHDEPFA